MLTIFLQADLMTTEPLVKPPLPRILLTILILFGGWFITTITLFVIGVGHMNTRLPAWYGWSSLVCSLLPLAGFVICTLIGLFRWTHLWLLLALALLALSWLGTLAVNQLVHILSPQSFQLPAAEPGQ
ncbi:hypothetical protein [Chitinilyticum piscinae]|uniref:Uncharacterized protein n=1 Tax=Chitinilyticum piscinae TaxID=2866724 RepID=A0A8J7FST6_9NEIS|nr:hypothetical protein [Chitinilyticum piscinae]MBE9609906.1 hypothetical protein [Chitinilyticum piscinae]